MKVLLTEKGLNALRKNMVAKYPYTQVKNDIYNVTLIDVYEVTIAKKFSDLLPKDTIKTIEDIKK